MCQEQIAELSTGGNEMAAQRLTLSVEECAVILGISRGSAYSAAARGDLPGVLRIGRRLIVSRARLMAMLAEPPAGGADGA